MAQALGDAFPRRGTLQTRLHVPHDYPGGGEFFMEWSPEVGRTRTKFSARPGSPSENRQWRSCPPVPSGGHPSPHPAATIVYFNGGEAISGEHLVLSAVPRFRCCLLLLLLLGLVVSSA